MNILEARTPVEQTVEARMRKIAKALEATEFDLSEMHHTLSRNREASKWLTRVKECEYDANSIRSNMREFEIATSAKRIDLVNRLEKKLQRLLDRCPKREEIR